MQSDDSDFRRNAPVTRVRRPTPLKVLVAGGFGVGKTTFIGSVSEIEPLRTEAEMTEVSHGVDDTGMVPNKNTTTVALDFGRITIDESAALYLFGTPGQDRFGFMWNELCRGALGAVVLVDSRRLEDSFAALDFFEERGLSFIVGLNHFDGIVRHDAEAVREALDLDPWVDLVECDARDFESAKELLLSLLELVRTRRYGRLRAAFGAVGGGSSSRPTLGMAR